MWKNALLTIALLIFAVTAQVRMFVLLPPSNVVTEDERVAANLARGRGWTDAFAPGTGPTAHLAPLYPLLLSGVYRVCGTYEIPSGRQAQAGFAIAVAALALALLPLLAHRLKLSLAAGWIAAFAVVLLPVASWSEVNGSHEQAFTTFTLLALIGALAVLQQSGWTNRRAVVATGIAVGVAALLCPNILLVPVLFLALESLCRPAERTQILRSGMVVAAIGLICITPWVARNYLVLGGVVPLRSNLGLELAVGNRPGADGHTYHEGFAEVHPFSNPAERARLVEMGEIAYMAHKRGEALRWIGDHPGEFGWLTLRRAWLFWFGPDESWCRLTRHTRVRFRVAAVIALTASLALIRLLHRGHPSGRLLTCALVGVAVPYFVTHVEARYRLPVVGLFALLSCDLALAVARTMWSKMPSLGAMHRLVMSVYRKRPCAWNGISTAR
jgi:hypothetical protein